MIPRPNLGRCMLRHSSMFSNIVCLTLSFSTVNEAARPGYPAD
jgi:hypothetical protein